MVKRELSKCRIWERERRDRLKSCFTALGKLLPGYDPSTTLSKIEILQRAATVIIELQTKNREILSGTDLTDAKNDELNKLQEHIKKLMTRNEQLSKLLQSAGIRIPNEIGTVTNFKPTKKWSGKIGVEAANNMTAKIENTTTPKKQNKENVQKDKQQKPAIPKKKKVISNENVDVNNKEQKTPQQQKKKLGQRRPKGFKRRGVNDQRLVTNPPTIGRPVYTNPSLGPGTLILANGSVLPVVTRPVQPVTTVPPAQPTTAVIVMHPTTTHIGARPLACRPGVGAKVPIPPLVPKIVRVKTNGTTTPIKNRRKSTIAKKSTPENRRRSGLTVRRANRTTPTKKDSLVEADKKSKKTSKSSEESKENIVKNDNTTNNTKSTKDVDNKQDDKGVVDKPNEITNKSGTQTVVENIPSTVMQDKVEKTNPVVEEIVQPSTSSASNLNTFTFELSNQQTTQANENSTEEKEIVVPPTSSPPADHSELSNDIFASLSVAGAGGHGAGGHHPESMSPTAAFLLAFPLVSTLTGTGAASTTGNVCRVGDPTTEDNSDSRQDTPTLLQIGTMDVPTTVTTTNRTTTTTDVIQQNNENNTTNTNLLALDSFTNFFTPTSATSCFASPVVTKQETKKTEPIQNVQHNQQIQQIQTNYTYEPISKPSITPLATTSDQRQMKHDQCNTYNPFADIHNERNYNYNNYQNYQQPSCEQNKVTKMSSQQTFNYNQQNHQQYKQDEKRNGASSVKAPVNWMTAPDTRHSQFSDYSMFAPIDIPGPSLFSVGQWSDGKQDQQFTTGSSYRPSTSTLPEDEVNRFSWSPGRLLPPLLSQDHHGNNASSTGVGVPSTLPTLVGDLALGTTPINFPGDEHNVPTHVRRSSNRDSRRKQQGHQQQGQGQQQQQGPQQQGQQQGQPQPQPQQQAQQAQPQVQHQQQPQQPQSQHQPQQRQQRQQPQQQPQSQHGPYESVNNTSASFSVSHLVNHHQQQPQKDDSRSNRRTQLNSSAKSNTTTIARHHHQQPHQTHQIHHNTTTHASASKRKASDSCYPRQQNKWQQHQNLGDNTVPEVVGKRFKQSTNPPSNYSAESLIGDTRHHQQHYHQQPQQQQQCQQYFPSMQTDHNYAPFTSYTPSTNYQTYPQQQQQHPQEQQEHGQQRPRNCPRRHSRNRVSSSHRHTQPTTETAPPPYADLGFLSMPTGIGSPLLSDDFPGGGTGSSLLTNAPPPPPPPPALYYRHYSGNGSPTTNTPTSLTNFNLSTIFPEIGGSGKGRTCPPDTLTLP